MRRGPLVLAVCGLSITVFSTLAMAAPPTATGDEAQKAAAKWLEGLGKDGLVLVETVDGAEDPVGFVGRQVIGRKSTMFVLQKPGWYVSLGFSDTIGPNTPLATVRKRFKYIALDRLPTPGLDIPGWEARPRTPVSSFKDGVKIVDYARGKIKLHVKTKFFALYGRNPNVLVPADAPSPPGSYFQIRQGFPLDLTIELPFAMGG